MKPWEWWTVFSDSTHCLHRQRPDDANRFLMILVCPEHAEITNCLQYIQYIMKAIE